jgi:hypothetical protein
MIGSGFEVSAAAWKFWFDVVQTAGLVAMGVWLRHKEKHQITDTSIKALDDKFSNKIEQYKTEHENKCGSHHQRTTALEITVRNSPTHKDLGDLHEKMNSIKSSVDNMSGAMTGIGKQVDLLVRHHLRGEGE